MHVAIIMDGNGRWAAGRSLPRTEGHRRGAEAVRRVVESAPGLQIQDLTLYAFSSDNWKRPQEEVTALMGLLAAWLEAEGERCRRNNIRFSAIGRTDRLPVELQHSIAEVQRATEECNRLHLRIALDYSARDAILRAAEACARQGRWTRGDFANELPAPDVDLVIRTAGEQRLSDFLLWECAYAEFYFTERMWPDFTGDDLAEAVGVFRRRVRRFGALPAA